MQAQIKQLIESHADRAYAIALRMTANPAEAGDVVQEAFLRVIKYMRSYDSDYPFEAWLTQIIRNVYLSSLRAEARRRCVPLSSVEGDDETLSFENALADPAPGPQAQAESRANVAEVQAALGTLGPNLRIAVILVDLEGMRRQDCAAALGCSLSALDVRLHRARAQLRKRIEETRQGASS